MKRIYWAAIVCSALLTGCRNSTQPTPVLETADEHIIDQEVIENALLGTYEGTLPADDCEGIRTTLKLHEDTTYDLKELYLGREEGAVETCGSYTILGDCLVELTASSSNEKIYYKIVNEGLMLSDAEGNENNSELADHYILRREN